MTERMTMANTDTTMLQIQSAYGSTTNRNTRIQYHVHAFIADTSGFTMVGNVAE